ncbi:hypothetical protein AX17_003885 [Amanita inopinata Kibby_2008]|nr:hypothetical protein AX17_003885 [Amanita inopinata Kibby_2008]
MDDASLAQQPLPRRQAAKQASANISQQLDDSDSDTNTTTNTHQRRIVVKYGRKANPGRGRTETNLRTIKDTQSHAILADSDSPSHNTLLNGSSAAKVRPRAQTGLVKKRPLSLEPGSRHASDSELSVSKTDRYSSSLSPPPASPKPISLTPRPFPLMTENARSSSDMQQKHTKASSHPKRWKKKELGEYVWALIDDHTRVFDRTDKAALDREHIWWPGKISLLHGTRNNRIPVSLYGQTALKIKEVEVQYPSEDNILPIEDKTLPFQAPTCIIPSHLKRSGFLSSPRKKPKRDRGDLEERWHTAVSELMAESDIGRSRPSTSYSDRRGTHSLPPRDTDEESLPEVGETNWKASLASVTDAQPARNGTSSKSRHAKKPSVGQAKRTRKGSSPSESDSDYGIRRLEENARGVPEEDDWIPPPADDALQIPGEIVLAKASEWDKFYWPARILAYMPPESKRERQGKYKLEYLDGANGLLKRNAFFTSDDDEFAICKLGQFESSYDDVANDLDTEDPLELSHGERTSSPIPTCPPPSLEAFCNADVRAQFAYTKPILVAVLNEQYPPARDRHDRFLKGGQARNGVVDDASLRGEMDPHSVGELQRWLCDWCLREERWAKRDDAHTINEFIGEQEDVSGDRVNHAGLLNEGNDQQLATSLKDDQNLNGSNTILRPISPSISPESISSTENPPDSMMDISAEDTKASAAESSPSLLSDLTRETTPMSVDAKETQPPEACKGAALDGGDIDDGLSDLTELDDIDAIQDTQELGVKESPRQYGCAAYEALSSIEKLDYCLNVLLPEAILQILLWRKGLRRSLELLPVDEEQRLHDEGLRLLHVTDWVWDVMRLRSSRVRQLARRQTNDSSINNSQNTEDGRVGGRLRRNIERINYQE